MENKPEKIWGDLLPTTEQTKKIFLFVGAGFGALTFVTGLNAYIRYPKDFPLEEAILTALSIAIYFIGIPYYINFAIKLIKPLFIKFDNLCKKNNIEYKLVRVRHYMYINFAKGTKFKDRLKLGLLYHLIAFLEIIALIFIFMGAMILMLIMASYKSQYFAL